jgi:hypothetical protein
MLLAITAAAPPAAKTTAIKIVSARLFIWLFLTKSGSYNVSDNLYPTRQ